MLFRSVAIGSRNGLPVFDDLGSGCFLDTARFGLAPEPMVQQSIAAGVGLAFFSGDKLVGGPQAGIVVGEKRYIDRLKKHPLARAVRTDKIRLAGLAATLIHYLNGEAETSVPVWRMISAPVAEVGRRAERWAQALGGMAWVVPGETMVGGMMKITKEMGDVPPHWLSYIAVADVDATTKKAEELGGKVLVPPTDIPTVGKFSVISDPGGAVVALITMPQG